MLLPHVVDGRIAALAGDVNGMLLPVVLIPVLQLINKLAHQWATRRRAHAEYRRVEFGDISDCVDGGVAGHQFVGARFWLRKPTKPMSNKFCKPCAKIPKGKVSGHMADWRAVRAAPQRIHGSVRIFSGAKSTQSCLGGRRVLQKDGALPVGRRDQG